MAAWAWFISSKLDSRLARRARARSSKANACSGPGNPAMAVALCRGRGNSLMEAAVITPSVPSAPMKSCFRS